MPGEDLENSAHTPSRSALPLSLAALGVVYGDIGTSPLYALKVAVSAAGGDPARAAPGIASLIFWSLIVVVSFKYAILILRADNRGEGGVVAMLALLGARHAEPRTRGAVLLVAGLIGASLLYGDGAITPAISVLSAVEGLKAEAPRLGHLVLPITIVILIGLFFAQSSGTGLIGKIFGPVMLVWFGAIAGLGIAGIAAHPAILSALNPAVALDLMLRAPLMVGFGVLGAVFLAVTGGEAMYADMGHFGRFPIRLAWFAVAMPALALNYFGQAALIVSHPAMSSNPFYGLAPLWMRYPLVAFATAATIIASQAIVSGVFSLTHQAIQLGFLPRLDIRHTAAEQEGQVYLPLANWLLAAATIAAVLVFRSSDALAGAYGVAVSGLMAVSTVLAALIALKWRFNPVMVIAVNGALLLLDLVFFSANAMKILEGGWFPLAIAGALAFVMLTWRSGVMLVENARAHLRETEDDFIRLLPQIATCRTDGIGAFLSASSTGVPLSLSQHVRHNRALQRRIVLVSVVSLDRPYATDSSRVTVVPLGDAIDRIIIHYGFMEELHIPRGVEESGLFSPEELKQISYYIGRETVIADRSETGMAHWREELFVSMQRNTAPTGSSFCIPSSQVVEIGAEVRI